MLSTRSGPARTATPASPKTSDAPVGACWPFIQAKFSQFIYGFYPEAERWRVNLTFILAVILLLPLLIPRLPAKGPNAILFFLAFPVVAFFLLHGGGLDGLRRELDRRVPVRVQRQHRRGRAQAAAAAGETTAVIGPLLWDARQADRADQHR